MHSHNFIDLTGKKFNRLTIQSLSHMKNKTAYWNCICDCGNAKIINGRGIRTGTTKSCGCYHKEIMRKRNTSHGYCGTRTYRIWLNMKNRCHNSNVPNFDRYGGKGIKVCDRWLKSFENFIADMGECLSDKHSIDRIDNSKGYFLENCKWSTVKEQANNRSSNRIIEFNNLSFTITEWSKKYNMKRETLRARLKRGWTIEDSITLPVQNIHNQCSH